VNAWKTVSSHVLAVENCSVLSILSFVVDLDIALTVHSIVTANFLHIIRDNVNIQFMRIQGFLYLENLGEIMIGYDV